MMKLKLTILLIGLMGLLQAQDVHFSQFYSAPIQLNPALTGYNTCMLRGGLMYKNQWRSVASPYVTYLGYVDGKLPYKLTGNDGVALGLQVYNDQAGGIIRNFKAVAAASYNKKLFKSFVSVIGVSVGVINRSLNTGGLLYDSQWNGTAFDPAMGSGEGYAATSMFKLDINAGILINMYKFGKNATLGVSLNHINKPAINFLGPEQRLNMKINVHGGFKSNFGDNMMVEPQFAVSLDGLSTDIIFGANFIYPYKGIDLYFGVWDRVSGDIIPVVGFDYAGWLFLLNYDVNYSKLRNASGYRGGLELSLTKKLGCAGGDGAKSGVMGQRKRNANKCPAYKY